MQEITVSELKSRMEAGEKINLLDVREPHEREVFNIGGTLFPLGKVMGMQLEDIDDLKEEEVIVYCRSGNRSAQACYMLQQFGFANVKNLKGGMLAWQEVYGDKM